MNGHALHQSTRTMNYLMEDWSFPMTLATLVGEYLYGRPIEFRCRGQPVDLKSDQKRGLVMLLAVEAEQQIFYVLDSVGTLLSTMPWWNTTHMPSTQFRIFDETEVCRLDLNAVVVRGAPEPMWIEDNYPKVWSLATHTSSIDLDICTSSRLVLLRAVYNPILRCIHLVLDVNSGIEFVTVTTIDLQGKRTTMQNVSIQTRSLVDCDFSDCDFCTERNALLIFARGHVGSHIFELDFQSSPMNITEHFSVDRQKALFSTAVLNRRRTAQVVVQNDDVVLTWIDVPLPILTAPVSSFRERDYRR